MKIYGELIWRHILQLNKLAFTSKAILVRASPLLQATGRAANIILSPSPNISHFILPHVIWMMNLCQGENVEDETQHIDCCTGKAVASSSSV